MPKTKRHASATAHVPAAPIAESSSSGSTTETENTSGADADTEDSMTTDEEVDRLVDAATSAAPAPAKGKAAEKWVNVKSAPDAQDAAETSSASTTDAAQA